MNRPSRPRHPFARTLARAARALERAHLAHCARLLETGAVFLP